ncbi:MAG: thioredoxin [Rikenellaceae bacterium]
MKKTLFLFLLLSCLTLTTYAQKVITLDNTNFVEKVCDYHVLRDQGLKYVGDKPAIIDFYATWCGPCKKISPILEELASEYSKDIYIYKVDVDKSRAIAEAFGISAMPTLLFIPSDGDAQYVRGAQTKEIYIKIINEILLDKKE